ncbi:hypothetical protein [Streptomyces sp. SAS_276]|uniref:hypothetical protein n=1 Tax=Streptomyces sp. SAS_276 TaxID=3412745 RepID=UPI00403C5029
MHVQEETPNVPLSHDPLAAQRSPGTPWAPAPMGAFLFWSIGRFGLADGNCGWYATGVKGRIDHTSSAHYYRGYLGSLPGGCR